jgi:APA family basic amino acid/polyamine antiporter
MYFSYGRYVEIIEYSEKFSPLLFFSIEYPAFLIGWLMVSLYQIGGSAVAVRWSHYVLNFIHLISDYNVTTSIVDAPIAWSDDSNSFYVTGRIINLPAIAITIAVTLVLFIGIRETAIVNLVFVVIKVIILLIFIIAGSIHIDRNNYTPFFPPSQGKMIYLLNNEMYTCTYAVS